MGDATKKVVVLGAGMVGAAIARDLADDGGLRVDVADVRPESLERVAEQARVGKVRADLGRPDAVRRLVAGYDLVVGALPSVIGFETVRTVIEAGRDVVDISFMPENALELDALARERGRDRGRGLRGGARALEPDVRAGGVPPRPVRAGRDLRRGPSRRAPLALRLQGGLRPVGRARGVHAPRAGRGARPRRREGAALGAGAPRLPGRRDPRGLQHRRPAEPRRHAPRRRS